MPFRLFGDGGGELYGEDENLDSAPRGDDCLTEGDDCWREDDASTGVRLRPRAFCTGVVGGHACALFAVASALFAAAATLFCSLDLSDMNFLVWALMKSRAKAWRFE